MFEKENLAITSNIAKSGEVRNWKDFGTFQLHICLINNHSKTASCHIAIVMWNKQQSKKL
jgi:hypothetical protein